MALEQLKVHEIVKQAVSKSVDIPEFQREFVWDTEQVKLLAESLYRNYPIGSFLLWDSTEYQEAKTAQGAQASLWIVDGQQRATALCLLLGMKPYWWPDWQDWDKALDRHDTMVNLLPDDGGDRLEFALPNPIRRRDPRWVSLRAIVSAPNEEKLNELRRSIVSKFSTDPMELLELSDTIHPRLMRLWSIRERDIPIVKINHEVEDVAEIFGRLNQAGTRVREADVILALAAVRNPGWVREQFLPFRNSLEDKGWDLDAGVFIRTMTAIGRGRARLVEVPRDFWSPENLPGIWEATRETIGEVLKRLAGYGIVSADLLPSTNSLIPLFELHYKWAQSPDYLFGRALKWFLLANRDGRYGGSAITSLNEDARTIWEAPDFQSALESLGKRLAASPEIDAEEFLSRYDRAGHRFLRLMLYLVLYHRGAQDWVDGTRLGYDKTGGPMSFGFQPQWHHIYPRSILSQNGRSADEIHALANITVLNERTNVNKLAGKSPWRYVQEFRIAPAVLHAHMIPPSYASATNRSRRSERQWDVTRYTDFALQRAQLLSQEAQAFLRGLDQ